MCRNHSSLISISSGLKGGAAIGTTERAYGRSCKQVRTFERDRLQTHFSEHSLVRSYRKDEETVYMRLTDESHKPYAKIAGEVQWVEFLGSKGVCVSRPLHSAVGNLAERIRMEDREYTAVCYEEAKGRPVGENEAGEDLYRRMGQFMGHAPYHPRVYPSGPFHETAGLVVRGREGSTSRFTAV